jgi:hypothetical protein
VTILLAPPSKTRDKPKSATLATKPRPPSAAAPAPPVDDSMTLNADKSPCSTPLACK